jgi:hypothetical protein
MAHGMGLFDELVREIFKSNIGIGILLSGWFVGEYVVVYRSCRRV